MAHQSEANADGYGLAALTSKQGMLILRNPVQAGSDSAYQAVAQRLVAAEMIVHLRYATNGETALVNTHPFTQDGRAFAHNGVIGDLDRIEERLGPNRAMVMGDTDSERYFALITLAIREAGGDVRSGIKAAVREVIAECELHSINFVMGELGHIWAFRYPENNPLLMHQRDAGGPGGDAQLDQANAAGTLRVRSDEAAEVPVVVFASEQISDEPGWEELGSGELVHVGPDMRVDRETIVTGPPRRPMVLPDYAVKSQSFK